MKYSKEDLMFNSLQKNIQEVIELCVENNIINAYDLMDVISNFSILCKYLKNQNDSVNLKGINNKLIDELERVFDKNILYKN